MKKQPLNQIPSHLEEFLVPTRSGIEKLLAAWDGLGVESQIILLNELSKAYAPRYTYLVDRVFHLALGNNNSYIRYLAAKELHCHKYSDCSDDQKKINNIIETDESSLVKYSMLESEGGIHDNFYQLPIEARLATVRGRYCDAESFVKVTLKAIEDGLLNNDSIESELNEVLEEYLQNSETQKHFTDKPWDGVSDYKIDKELTDLWGLIPKLPEFSGLILTQGLPSSSGGILGGEPYEDILKKLTPRQLSELLLRDDVPLKNFRKQVFWKGKAGYDWDTYEDNNHWSEAVSSNFTLTDEEFSKIFAKPKKEQKGRLSALANSPSLELHQYLAISVMLVKLNKKNWNEMIDIQSEWAQNKVINIIKEINYYEEAVVDSVPLEYSRNEFNEEKLIKFRLCYLAAESSDWWAEDELQFLHDKRVKKDLWKTYLSFSDAFKQSKLAFKDLPRVFDYEDFDD